MRMLKLAALFGGLAVLAVLLSGCGGASESKPMSEVRAEAEKMSASELRSMAQAYKAALEAKKKDLEKIQQKIKEIPLTEILGEESKKLKAEVEKFGASVSALTERFKVYLAELKKKNGDTSGLD